MCTQTPDNCMCRQVPTETRKKIALTIKRLSITMSNRLIFVSEEKKWTKLCYFVAFRYELLLNQSVSTYRYPIFNSLKCVDRKTFFPSQ